MLPLAVGVGGHGRHILEIELPHLHRRGAGHGHMVTVPIGDAAILPQDLPDRVRGTGYTQALRA
jgi:hypothetical protein